MARQSISRIVTGLAEADPDRVVARDDAGTLTASQLDRASSVLARAYLDLGVGHDSLVTVALPNTVEMIVVCAAIWRCGATPQPISLGLDAAERAELEALVRPALVVGVPSAGAGGGAGRAAGAGGAGGVPWVPAGWVPPPVAGDAPPLPDAWASSWKAPTSSGSTGRPKVVLAAAPALLDPSAAVASFLPRDQVQLVAGPLTHSATFTYAFRGLLTGHELVLLPRFDERRMLRAIASHRVTWALVVPTMMHRLLRLPDEERAAADLSSLQTVLHLGAPCPPDLKRRFMAWVGAERVVEVYAGSESNGVLTIRGDEWLEHPGSVGRPGGGTSVAVRTADGDDLPEGTVGQVWLRRAGGPTYRYLGGRSARTDDGWDTLGDLGRLDPDGYLHLVDRVDDVVLRGGVNVHPTEVERVLEAHPAVRGAVAFGVADDDLGQRIEAVVDVAGAAAGVTAEELLAWARQRLDPERRPAALWLVDEPVRDDAGKTSRRAWAARAHQEAGSGAPGAGGCSTSAIASSSPTCPGKL
ncbi:AMP-binding protein [Frigoribacterium sp. CFBP 8766]|uniref:AMP-binding protein n=1 Tax=Frigoribacterium sp. CFBP 8766 TaxID=2775273 RepID=UPI0017815B3A|nr:AMP-binding protein [Frigoribacterium sp. CFBP 8766]MBD8585401.1 AMP-binding protein [Frigoribacterium sp. CFBP 8766]